MELLGLVLIVFVVGLFGVLTGTGRARDDRSSRRWESAFFAETHRQTTTDATGMLMCRSCGASAAERGGRCPSCGAVL